MRTRIPALVVLIAFSLYTAWTLLIAEQSLIAFALELLARPDTAQVVIDLYLMATLGCIWMVRDTKTRGRPLLSVLPYVLITLIFVSLGPLLYLVIRGFGERKEE